jgi:hypothetical protein
VEFLEGVVVVGTGGFAMVKAALADEVKSSIDPRLSALILVIPVDVC